MRLIFLTFQLSQINLQLATYFGTDQTRFKAVGLSLYGIDNSYVSFICVDNNRSTAEKEHLVTISIDKTKHEKIQELIFKRLHIVLFDNKDDEKYLDHQLDEQYSLSSLKAEEE